jgi:hypothetical protein
MLIEQVPDANYSTLKCIIQFLASFSINTENKDAVDVSMIFAPFILHAEASTEEVEKPERWERDQRKG